MKTGKMICLLSVVFVALFVGSIAAQQTSRTAQQQLNTDVANGQEQGADRYDPAWGDGDWRFRSMNKGWHEKLGYPLIQPATLYEWLEDTRQTFKKAETGVVTKEGKELFAACQKSREAGIVFQDCYLFYGAPEVSRVCYSGPFISLAGRRDHELKHQGLCVALYNDWMSAVDEYNRIARKTSEKVKLEVVTALFNARGNQQAVRQYQENFRDHQRVLENTGTFSMYVYLPFDQTITRDMTAWKAFFKRMEVDANGWKPTPGARGIVQYNLCLRMDVGSGIGSSTQRPITRDEIQFILRQVPQARKTLLAPPADFLSDAPRFTYWQRDGEGNEPPLVLKVLSPKSVESGHAGTIITHNHLPASFLKGFCPEWKQAMDAFEKILPTDGVSSEYVAWYHGRVGSYDTGNLSEDARRKWVQAINEKEDELYSLHFATERNKWYEIQQYEYAASKAKQDEWLKANDGSVYLQKVILCSVFENRAATYEDWSSTSSAMYSLDAIEPKPLSKVIANQAQR